MHDFAEQRPGVWRELAGSLEELSRPADALLALRRRSAHDEVIVQHKNVHEWRGSGSEANGRPAVASSSFSDPYRRPMWVTATRSFGFYGGNGTRLVFLPDAQQTRVGQPDVFKPPCGIP